LTKRYTKNTEAHQLYLKGRFYWNKRTEAAFVKGIEFFEQAIQSDPNYALAYTGLADSYMLLGSAAFEVQRPKETMPRAKRAAEKALKIDDSLAEAHTTRAQITRLYDWKWVDAERGFRRALELNPNYATSHHWYALLLSNLGRLNEGLAEIRRAQGFDPLSLAISTDVGWCLYFARRYEEAIEEYRKALEMDPNFFWTHYLLGLAYAQQARFLPAIEQFRRAVSLSEGTTKVLGPLGHAYAMSGQRAEALRLLDQLEELAGQKYVSSYAIALIHVGLGEKERALERLRQAYRERAGHLVYLKVDPYLDALRDHPSFGNLLRRMKFPE
jgi:tetratricopeptide (TPR) repeat protein